MATSATRRILHITTDYLTDLNETQFGNSLSANAYYHNASKRSDWGGKDIYGDVQTFAALDTIVKFEKIYIDDDVKHAIIIATQASSDESSTGTTRAEKSINIGRGAGIDMVDNYGHINIGEFAGRYSQGGSIGYGQDINIGWYCGVGINALHAINIGNCGGADMSGSFNTSIGSNAGWGLNGDNNNVIGRGAGKDLVGDNNDVIGDSVALQLSGNNNFIGGKYAATYGHFDYGVALGFNAGTYTRSDSGDVIIGRSAGVYTSGDNNIMIGTDSGGTLSGSDNVIIGRGALYQSTSVSGDITNNVIIGPYAGETPTGAYTSNVAIGVNALGNVDDINSAVAIGEYALESSSGCSETVAIGDGAGTGASSFGSVFIGKNAGANESNDQKLVVSNQSSIILSGDFTTGEVIMDHLKLPATTGPSIDTNYGYLFSSASAGQTEVFAANGAGTITKISPHNNDGEWEYFSYNKKTGKVVRINMEKFIRKMEEFTGETFIEEI